MRTILKLLGGLVLLLALVVAVATVLGSRLPEAHTAEATVVLQAPIERVWHLIADNAGQPGWRKGLKSVSALPPQNGRPCWLESNAMGKMAMCETQAAPPLLRDVRIADPRLPFGGDWLYTLSPVDANTTRLTITEHGITRPAMWRFLGHYVFHEDMSIRQFERDLQSAVNRA